MIVCAALSASPASPRIVSFEMRMMHLSALRPRGMSTTSLLVACVGVISSPAARNAVSASSGTSIVGRCSGPEMCVHLHVLKRQNRTRRDEWSANESVHSSAVSSRPNPASCGRFQLACDGHLCVMRLTLRSDHPGCDRTKSIPAHRVLVHCILLRSSRCDDSTLGENVSERGRTSGTQRCSLPSVPTRQRWWSGGAFEAGSLRNERIHSRLELDLIDLTLFVEQCRTKSRRQAIRPHLARVSTLRVVRLGG